MSTKKRTRVIQIELMVALNIVNMEEKKDAKTWEKKFALKYI